MPAPIRARVYQASAPNTLIAELEDAKVKQWRHVYRELGSGSLMVHETDPILSAHRGILNQDNIVKFEMFGEERFGFIIDNRSFAPAPTDEEAGRYKKVSGRGLLGLLANAVILPERGLAQPTTAQYRAFGFMSAAYDDSAWDPVVTLQQWNDPSGLVPDYRLKPVSWPDPIAYWMWSELPTGTFPSEATPVGTVYFRRTFTLAAETAVALHVACDNADRVWVDSEIVIDNISPSSLVSFTDQAEVVNRILAGGSHTIAIEARNLPLPTSWPGTRNPAGLIVALMETDPNFSLTGNVLLRSDSDWNCLAYPAEPPGMTPGQIERIISEEAQARGALPGITFGFTNTDDSKSAAWDEEPDIQLPIGVSVLDGTRILMEQFMDVEMTAALELEAYRKGTQGSDLTGSVVLVVGEDFEELVSQGDEGGGESHLANVIYARTQDGELSEHTHAGSLDELPRKETYIEIATATSEARAAKVSDALFEEFAFPSIQLSGKAAVNAGAYTIWKHGDLITAPSEDDGSAVTTAVLSLIVDEDQETGDPIISFDYAQDQEVGS